jgi:hypothetical protein
MRGLITLLATTALVFTTGALAASPAEQGYGGRGAVQSEVAHAATGGALPFTGFDLALLALGGALLLVVGVFLRRAARAD